MLVRASIEIAKQVIGGARRYYTQPFKTSYLRPLRLKYLDGGTLLAVRIQFVLKGQRAVIRINHLGEVSVNREHVGSSYGSRNLGRLMMGEYIEKREIAIAADPSISGKKIETFITGLNSGNISQVNALQGCAIVFIKDYNLLPLLQKSEVPVIKVNPELNFTNQELLNFVTFFKKNASLLRDFRWFNPHQRTVLLKLLKRNLLAGIFDFWEVLSGGAKTKLLDDLSQIDIEQVHQNIQAHRSCIESKGMDKTSNSAQIKGKLDKPIIKEITELSKLSEEELTAFAERGKKYKEEGTFGVVVMAAGAAARFGQGPKALVEVDKNRTFMKITAEDILAASKKAKKDIPLFVMVSPSNADAIRKHFNDNGYFGLRPNQVFFLYQIDKSPKIDLKGRLVLTDDKEGIDFAPTGHGFAVKGIKTQVAPICRELGIKTLLIKNIDNLGATVRDESYDEVLGHHLSSGKGITVELVEPKVGKDPITGEEKLLDSGGGALMLDGKNVLVELSAVPKELLKTVTKNPFNTLTLTVELGDFEQVDPDRLPWYITDKELKLGILSMRRNYQFEQLLGDVTHQVETNFVIVKREGKKGRFIPVKFPKDREPAKQILLEMEELKND